VEIEVTAAQACKRLFSRRVVHINRQERKKQIYLMPLFNFTLFGQTKAKSLYYVSEVLQLSLFC